MRRWLINVALLCAKEFRSLLCDKVLIALIVFAFTGGVLAVADGVKVEVSNATVAFIDHDHSTLSNQLRDAILQPYFKPPVLTNTQQAEDGMDKGDYIFAIDIPPNFERDVLAGREPSLQIRVDATAMTQAGLGTVYLTEIFYREIKAAIPLSSATSALPFQIDSRIYFNPNTESYPFMSVMQIVTNITMLSIILVGAAVIREKEHGTIEHLLVLPVSPSEIAMAKIIANGWAIFIASMLSLWLVVHLWLGVQLSGSILLFAVCTLLYLFSVTALGIMLATVAPTMPQFGLLVVPVYAVAYLLSGAATPVENMPTSIQHAVYFLPTTQFVNIAQAILYRGAGFDAITQPLVIIIAAGILFLAFALIRFRSMLTSQS